MNRKEAASSGQIDDVNRRLLTELHANPRLSMSALARRVGLSAPTVTERVKQLEATGVIRGYHLDVDPAALGLPVTAYTRVKPGPGQLSRITALALSTATVSECYRITGEDCFLIKIHAPTIAELEATLDQFLLYGQTITSIVVTTPVSMRPLPVNATNWALLIERCRGNDRRIGTDRPFSAARRSPVPWNPLWNPRLVRVER